MANLQKEYPSEKIRNIALIGHGGAGKTTFSEAVLFTSGMTNRMGTIEDGATVSDYHADEIERKISINNSLVYCDWNGVKINILDTPGYADFIGDVVSSLRVTDMALLFVKAAEGIEVGTESVWAQAKTNNLPVILTINKTDNENARFDDVLSATIERFGHDVLPLQFPANQGINFDSVVDVLKMKLFKFNGDGSGKFTVEEIPGDFKAKADKLHEEMVEKVAESNEQLMNAFFEQGTLSEEDLKKGLRLSVNSRKLFPVFCTAASANIGIAPLLDFISEYGPSPKDRGAVDAVDTSTNQQIKVESDASNYPALFVFKSVSEKHVGELSFFRVYSGVISPGLDLVNTHNTKSERLGQLFLMNGNIRKDIAKLNAGDLGAVVKLKDTHTNDSLCNKGHLVAFSPTVFPEPAICVALKSKVKGEEEKIATGLHTLHQEDPTLVVEVDGKLSQTLMKGQGELHLLIHAKRLKEKYGVDVDMVEPRIPFRETIKAVVPEIEYKHKKQTGGRGQYGHVVLKIEPKPRGTGFEFVDAIVGGVVPGRFIPAVEKGIIDTMAKGVLAHNEVVDIRVTLTDGSYHDVDSDELSFRLAGTMAFKKGFLLGRPTILEPIDEVEIKVPEENMGDVMGDISGRRGKILGMESDGSYQCIKSLIPASELYKYSTILRSMTQGRGIFHSKFSHYDEAPREVIDKLVANAEKVKEEGE